MIKKILLPTDGSELSTKAINGAVELAAAIQASIVGITVVEPYSYSSLSSASSGSFFSSSISSCSSSLFSGS